MISTRIRVWRRRYTIWKTRREAIKREARRNRSALRLALIIAFGVFLGEVATLLLIDIVRML